MKKHTENKKKRSDFFTKEGTAIFVGILLVIAISYGIIVLSAMHQVGTEIRADGGYGAVCGEPDDLGLRHSCWKKI